MTSSARPTLAGHPVARIGYGAMQLARIPHDQALEVLRTAVRLGVDHLDTAAFYGPGTVNERIREALSPYAEGLVVVTKVGARRDAGGDVVAAQRPEELRAEVERNLTQLGVERLDVVNLRRMDRLPGVLATGEQLVDLDDQLATMTALREEGKIAAFGLSSIDVDQLEQALPAGIACVQNAYSVLDRSAEPLVALCAEHDVRWVPYFPLGSAFPDSPKVVEDPVVLSVAARLDLAPSAVGLAWLLAHDPGTLLIPGTSSVEHLRDNLAVAEIVLDEEAMTALDAVG